MTYLLNFLVLSFLFSSPSYAMKILSCGEIFHDAKSSSETRVPDFRMEPAFQDEMDFSKLSSKDLRNKLDSDFQVAQKIVHSLENASVEEVRYLFQRLVQSMASFQTTESLIKQNETLTTFSDSSELLSFAHHKRIALDQLTFGNSDLFKKLMVSFQDRKNLSRQTENLWKQWVLLAQTTGVDLDSSSKAELISIETQIHQWSQIFKEKFQLAQSHLYRLPLTTQFQSDMPASVLIKAKDLGQKEGVYAFTLSPEGISQFHPVLKYAVDPAVRKDFYEHYVNRVSGLYDVEKVVQTLANLRLKKAQILGQASFADFKLPLSMTGSSQKLDAFIQNVKPGYIRMAEDEMELLRQEKMKDTSDPKLNPWDVQFYATLYQKRIQSFSAQEVAMYFPMDRTVKNILNLVEQLYQVQFVFDPDASVWNSDVKAYRVYDQVQKKWMGTLYTDLFERKGKQEGAFAEELQAPGLYLDSQGKTVQRLGQVFISTSIPKVKNTSEVYLSLDQVVSILHELGHGMHSLSYQQNTPILSSFKTSTDFVELPSQVLENWAFHPEILRQWGRHAVTGQALPESWIQDLRKQRQILSGIKSFARRGLMTEMDHRIHSIQTPIQDMKQFEANVTKDWKSVPYLVDIAGKYSLFRYIFFQGYESGFHGYQCCEVLDFDVYEYVTRDQVIDPKKGLRFRQDLLSLGAMGNLSEAYIQFRGQAPDSQAILRKAGYSKPQEN